VLNVHDAGGATTIVGDLETPGSIPEGAFDCLVVTQTLHLLFDLPAAIAQLHAALRPGGTLLLTVPGTISQVEDGDWTDRWHWGFTAHCLRRLFEPRFGAGAVHVRSHGNVLAAVALLEGLAAEELEAAELDAEDRLYPVLLTLHATRP
jgi:SAM-dependent methyltransferase